MAEMAHTTAAPATKATVLVVDRKPYPRYDPARSRLDGARLVELDCADVSGDLSIQFIGHQRTVELAVHRDDCERVSNNLSTVST